MGYSYLIVLNIVILKEWMQRVMYVDKKLVVFEIISVEDLKVKA